MHLPDWRINGCKLNDGNGLGAQDVGMWVAIEDGMDNKTTNELMALATYNTEAALELARRGYVREYRAGKPGAWIKVG